MSKVSILIPCYNAERWIRKSIQSAIDQTYANKEIIIVDDGSTDESLNIIKSFGNCIRWKTQPNQGANITRNNLLELSSGDWLQYLDADDELFPDKISLQIKYIQQNPQTDILYSPVTVEYWEGNQSRSIYYPIAKPHDPWLHLIKWQLPQTGSPIWRKDSIIAVGGWKVDQPCCQEHDLYLRLLIANKSFRYYEIPVCLYRWWSETSVCRKDVSQTYQQRLKILSNAETHLRSINCLNDSYLNALIESRFQIARSIWNFDTLWANNLVQSIYELAPKFQPSFAPSIYKFLYKVFGFQITESIAKLKRSCLVF